MKTCSKCGEEKARADFYAHPTNADGLFSHCKKCHCEMTHAWRKKNRDKVSSYNKRFRKARPEVVLASNETWATKNPEKIRAGKRLGKAVASGKIVKPDRCEGCDEPKTARQLDGHHEDYSKPFDVDWLCRQCHVDRHNAVSV